nr:MAG TPA: hypothetical protein [Caudoviricetes sp.]
MRLGAIVEKPFVSVMSDVLSHFLHCNACRNACYE